MWYDPLYMNEHNFNPIQEEANNQTPETGPEYIPTKEEILSQFERLIDGEYTLTNQLEDERGVYYVEAIGPGESEGEQTEYIYIRKGGHVGARSTTTVIQVVYYEGDLPVGGDTLANLVDGEWVDC